MILTPAIIFKILKLNVLQASLYFYSLVNYTRADFFPFSITTTSCFDMTSLADLNV